MTVVHDTFTVAAQGFSVNIDFAQEGVHGGEVGTVVIPKVDGIPADATNASFVCQRMRFVGGITMPPPLPPEIAYLGHGEYASNPHNGAVYLVHDNPNVASISLADENGYLPTDGAQLIETTYTGTGIVRDWMVPTSYRVVVPQSQGGSGHDGCTLYVGSIEFILNGTYTLPDPPPDPEPELPPIVMAIDGAQVDARRRFSGVR